MSVLLQALQKAAKNRDDSTGNSPVQSDTEPNLKLEPLAEPQLGDQIQTTDESPSELPSSPDDAADVISASAVPSYSAVDWARDHYMLTFLAGAVLFAICYGLYVYLQVSNPSWLRSTPAPVSTPDQAVLVQPAPASINESPRITGLPEPAVSTGPEAFQEATAAASEDANEPITSEAATVGTTDAPAKTIAPSSKPSAGTPRRATAASQSPVASTNTRPKPSRSVSSKVDSEGVEMIEIPVAPSVAVGGNGTAAREARTIEVRSRDRTASGVDPVLMMAYEALQQGQYEKATELYQQYLFLEPNSTDAMLGLAAIAWKQGRLGAASQYYGQVLKLDPRDTHAQAGLIAIVGNADPVAAETRLKQLIDRDPSGFLYFTLGNLYAKRALWSQAQQAYFQAYQLQPNNSDFAFNLAVGLEHLGQTRPALDYYRKALDLSFKNGRANFDQNLAIERVGQLSARVD